MQTMFFLTCCLLNKFTWSISHVLNVDKYLWMIKYAYKGLLGNVGILAFYQTNPSVNDLARCLEMNQVDLFKMNHMWNTEVFWCSCDSKDCCAVLILCKYTTFPHSFFCKNEYLSCFKVWKCWNIQQKIWQKWI